MLNILYPLLIQTPSGTPKPGDSDPVDFSDPFNMVVFIILPILLIIFYIYWKRSKDDNQQE